MLVHYPRQYDHPALPLHYQSSGKAPKLQPRQSPVSSSTSISSSRPPFGPLSLSMPTSHKTSNPTVRIRKSTPAPPLPLQSTENQLMLAHSPFLGSGWGSEGSREGFQNTGFLDTLAQKTGRYHKRLSSGSSVTSAGPPSPHDHTSSPYCQIVGSDSSHFSPLDNFDCVSTPPQNSLVKSLPSPAGTPTSNTFMPPGYHNVAASQDTIRYTSSAMRRIQSTNGDDDNASFAFSGPQSASSMSQSPATPQTNYDHDYDEKNFARGFPQSAAFNQAMQDVFPDQMYNTSVSQNFSQQAQSHLPHTSSHLSPYRNIDMFSNRLQAANQDHMAQRTHSPATSVARERSPFNPYNNMQNLGNHTSTEDQMSAMTQALMGQSRAPTAAKSVSPKELLLEDPEVDDGHSTPLFPEQFDRSPVFPSRRPNPAIPPFRAQSGMYSGQSFAATPAQVPQQYPFVGTRRRQLSGIKSEDDQVPEFPAHMVSMETTVEEGPSEPTSSQQSDGRQVPAQPAQRPDDTSTDSGTYTCTYHGCTLRFDTPVQLQKHKRDAHRHGSPSAGPVSAPIGPTNLGLRNSQAGPHKCERINPSTGKPCNSIFSRPYDLTRHEDTIHNARKQKVRCHLCTEKKTFSRNDALTRHMRVVHPDVDWPGKTRRGKGQE